MRTSELFKKQVVSMKTGEMLGKVIDLEFNPNNYEIQAIVIGKKASFFLSLFMERPKTIVNIYQIEALGKDCVLIQDASSKKSTTKQNNVL